MTKYKHFVITLFNLRLSWTTDKKNNRTGTDRWLAERFDLFDKYCFPSVSTQTNKNFVWLCLFDIDTPLAYKERIKEYEAKCPQMAVCYFRPEDMEGDWVDHFKDIIKGYMSADDAYLIITNADNDDMIHQNMVERIQSEFEKNHKEGVYSMLYGYQYFPDNGLLLKMRYPHNHFLSLVERYNPDFKTLKSEAHGRIRRYYDNVDIEDEPYWVEFVHSRNVNNSLRITSRIKYYPVFRTVSFNNFGLDQTLTKGANIKNTLTVLPWLFIKTAFHKIKKKAAK
ncbi:hypothetical protein D0T84_02675 [Dysgonomonas sp. 521]|uniref:glycosyltransferase n=1 Tax=Dysgonomonas sp. 521 TaxID=2302932 RepID=UPI0013D18E36|nr:glycosyltransferase [Dysgonomonas sp. 521]NDV93822.1 hypothetical protein [Dysgonomonas sp. 521]